MANATFVHGSTIMVDHIPSSDVSAGDIVVVGEETRIAHSDIAANTLGALAAPGGDAVYDVTKDDDDDTMTAGAKVWWDAGNSVATTTQSTHKPLGFVVETAAKTDDTVRIRHAYFSSELDEAE